jgi:recombination protein RecR
MKLPSQVQEAVDAFSRIPGVGSKTAFRQVMSMLRWNDAEREKFSAAISVLSEVKNCHECGMYCEEEICEICSSEKRDQAKTLCVIENISDLMAIENSGGYRGRYYVLGGVLNPLSGIGPSELKIDRLINKVKEKNIQNVILAINPSVEGDATCSYIRSLISDSVNVERIGFGVPIGGNLEFLDPLTITKAIENRRMFE